MTANNSRPIEAALLDFFVGNWELAGQVLPGRFGPGGATHGVTVYGWELGGTWLSFHSELSLPGLGNYEVNGGVAYDGRRHIFQSFAYNSLGILIVYDGVWEDPDTLVFTSTYPAPNQARVIYRKLPGDAILMRSEQICPSGVFETYFETTLTQSPLQEAFPTPMLRVNQHIGDGVASYNAEQRGS